MVTARSRTKKRRKKKAQKSAQNRARGPAIFLIFAFVATGILLIAQVDQGPSSNSTPIAFDNTTIAPGFDLSSASGIELAFDERVRAASFVGQSHAMVEVFKLVGKVAPGRTSVAIGDRLTAR